MVGKPATEQTFAAAGAAAAEACEPMSDMRGSADYKRHLASELTIRTLRTSVERVRNAAGRQGN
jgi:carbon-monoxide dehydrogenase medium subunit